MSSMPQMGSRKREYIENLLLSFTKPHLSILEWGSGGSTIYFTSFLKRRGIPYDWWSLEYNREWFEKIKKELPDAEHTHLVFIDPKGNPRRKDVCMDEYVVYPRTLLRMFDLIIVDGRKRRRCLLEARELLASDGFVLLDDAFRPYYWCAMRVFPESRFLWFSFWRGSLKAQPRIRRTLSRIHNNFYQALALLRYYVRRAKLILARLASLDR